jgi:hypothetical protein
MSTEPKEYKVKCLLGAIYAPDIGFISEFAARSRVSKDPANLIPQTYYLRNNYSTETAENPSISQRLKPVLQNSGGLIPAPNPYIGAPLSTFVFGALAPDEPHPQLDNIMGPSKTKAFEFEKGIFYQYNPVFDGGEADFGGTGRDGNDAPDFEDESNFGPTPSFLFQGAQYPSIPSTKAPPFNVEQKRPTYNIWQHVNISNNTTSLKYRKNFGPIYPDGYSGGTIRQSISVDGDAYIVVTSQNTVTQLERIFPIAADLAYEEDTKIYYPKAGETEIAPKTIKARGSDNCGFQIHFKHAEIAKMSNPKSGNIDGGIKIQFGAKEYPQDGQFIQNFQINLTPGQTPQLHYYHPAKQAWETFPLNGPSFGSGEFKIFVHYAGPNMLIGFDENVESWNAFVPLDSTDDGETSVKKPYYARQPVNSKINITFSNITASFKYGPIAFNNYHPENVSSEREIDPDLGETDHYGQIQVNLTAQSKVDSNRQSVDRSAALDENKVNFGFQSQRLYGENAGNEENDPERIDNRESSASMYADWRRQSPEMIYKQTESDVNSETGEKNVRGKVIFDTTIEGPQFQYIRAGNSRSVPTTSSQQNINEYFGGSLDGKNKPTSSALDDAILHMPWGDISDFVESWQVNVSFLNSNHSYMQKKATVVLRNLRMTSLGRQIQNAIEKNNLTIQLGAGPGVADTYFEGVIIDSKTKNTPTGSITTITCVDIATQIFSDVPCSTVLFFQSMRYGRIIEYAVAMSGLYDWYEQSDDVKLSDALNLRLGYIPLLGSLATQVLSASPQKKIIDILKPALGLVVDVNSIPVFYWDDATGRLRLDRRQSELLLDELTFAGYLDPDTNAAFLPNNSPEGQHGVLHSDGWETTTNNKQLYAGMVLYGQNWYGRVITYSEINNGVFQNRFNKTGLADLINSVGENASTKELQGGYIGYRKIFVDQTQSNLFPDSLSLKRYGEKLREFMLTPYQRISFKCYVTRPLKHAGQFQIKTFLTPSGLSADDSDISTTTGSYLYSDVTYSFKKSDNFIIADIKGEQLPPVAYNN